MKHSAAMVYTSLPPHLDPPNWNKQSQQPTQQQPLQGARTGVSTAAAGDVCATNIHRPQQQRMLPPPPTGGSSMEAEGTVRPNSMAERARLARLPQPEQALKCPRCDSTNTKFCYYNNYSLSQPRHFCKACRRYWTRGGALRNVPVGGGCRRNKRSKSNNGSKQASGADTKAAGPSQAAASGGGSIGAIRADLTAPPQLPFLPSLPEFGSGNVGFSYCGTTVPDPVHDLAATGSSLLLEPWRLTQLHQLPFFNSFESAALQPPPSSLEYHHPFVGEGAGGHPSQVLKIDPSLSPGMKLERQFMGINGSSDTYWQDGSIAGSNGPGTGSVGNGGSVASHWTDLSSLDSSSRQILL